MNAQKKELIDEMIQYSDSWQQQQLQVGKYLQKAFENMVDHELHTSIGDILVWQRDITLDLEDPERYDMSEWPYWVERMRMFFEYCPEVKEIFALTQGVLMWNANISAADKKEISEYIDKTMAPTKLLINRRPEEEE